MSFSLESFADVGERPRAKALLGGACFRGLKAAATPEGQQQQQRQKQKQKRKRFELVDSRRGFAEDF
jgi:hypothetical protein